MPTIAEIDKNLLVKEMVNREGLVIYDAHKAPFSIHGLIMPDECHDFFRRLPLDVAEKTESPGLIHLNHNTAGGRLRFRTNSRRIAIFASMCALHVGSSHFSKTGATAFDLYVNGEFDGTFVPPYDLAHGYESEIKTENGEMKEIQINFPSYSGLKQLYIGLDSDAEVLEGKCYREIAPIVYYGSSITQGACASRPGRTYPAIIERRCNIDYINLGFSGNAKAEDCVISHIASLDMSVFVMDYDHNAPSLEHLKNTHEKLFLAVREKHPNIPIIIMPKPDHYGTPGQKARFEVIKKTYDNAKARGDENVYLIDICRELYTKYGNEYTVEGTHPTDVGFFGMAEAVWEVMKTVI